MIELSERTDALIRRLFLPPEQEKAEETLVAACGSNLPFIQDADAAGLERIRFAALRLSRGDLGELRRAIDLAQADWRDLLMAAGFGRDPNAHEKWATSILDAG
ncbi:MAG: hypothetical protein JW751_31380 [Polyangiaceae bacterium]|nr:hypothetical protein [Polyangiaceae bacterium]